MCMYIYIYIYIIIINNNNSNTNNNHNDNNNDNNNNNDNAKCSIVIFQVCLGRRQRRQGRHRACEDDGVCFTILLSLLVVYYYRH